MGEKGGGRRAIEQIGWPCRLGKLGGDSGRLMIRVILKGGGVCFELVL